MAARKKPQLRRIMGQPSYLVETGKVRMAVAELGGFMAPVTFCRDTNHPIEPLAVAPWWNEPLSREVPKVIGALRGDFFCMPFGGGERYRGRDYPPHGETVNRVWRFGDLTQSDLGSALHLRLDLLLQKGRVEKSLALVEGQNLIYSRHRISGLTGPMPYAHHATIQFPDRPGSGTLSFSRFKHAATYHSPVESPEMGTYSILKPGATVRDLSRAPRVDGKTTDLTSYPNRRGYEDLAMVCADPRLEYAWSAVTFPRERYVWFQVKDPSILASTVLWFTNGGRHYEPWCGRHVNVLGMEEATTFWADGITASARENTLTQKGITTSRTFRANETFDVPLLMGVTRVPHGFKRVSDIEVNDDRLRLIDDESVSVDVRADTGFIKTGVIEGLID